MKVMLLQFQQALFKPCKTTLKFKCFQGFPAPKHWLIYVISAVSITSSLLAASRLLAVLAIAFDQPISS